MFITDGQRERILTLQNIAAGYNAPISEERRQALLNMLNSLPEGTDFKLYGDYNETKVINSIVEKTTEVEYEIEIVIKV